MEEEIYVSTTTAVRVIGPNGHITFEGEEILHEEQIVPHLVGRKIVQAYRDVANDVGILFEFEDGTWFAFSYSGNEGMMSHGKVAT